LGSLGFELAKWLAEKSVKHIVLTGRRDPSTEQQVQVDQLQKIGVNIVVKNCDVTKKEEVNNLIELIKNTMPPLKGIFHTAGVVDDGIISQQNWERFEKVFAPKVQGSWNLHEATKEMNLDYFVLYSSIVSVLGLAGQSNYAAANAFMDGLSAHRNFHGLSALSVNWGPWGEVGMAVRQHMKIPGMPNLSLKKGLEALNKLLKTKLNQVMVAPMNWEAYERAQAFKAPLLKALVQKLPKEAAKGAKISLKEKLTSLSEDEREKALEEYLASQVRSVLNLKESQALENNRGFFDIGMDSLMAVELKNKLQQDVGIEKTLISTLIFNYPSIIGLKEYFINNVFPEILKKEVKPETLEKAPTIEEEVQKLNTEDLFAEALRAVQAATNDDVSKRNE
jgi:short-subunit dehydrogenase/acyl carrier protein